MKISFDNLTFRSRFVRIKRLAITDFSANITILKNVPRLPEIVVGIDAEKISLPCWITKLLFELLGRCLYLLLYQIPIFCEHLLKIPLD